MASWLTGSHWSPPDGLLPWHLLSFGQSLPSTTQGHTPLENATKESEYIFFYSPFGYWQSCYRRRYIRASVFSLHLSSSQKKKKKKNQPPTTHASRVEREREKTLLIVNQEIGIEDRFLMLLAFLLSLSPYQWGKEIVFGKGRRTSDSCCMCGHLNSNPLEKKNPKLRAITVILPAGRKPFKYAIECQSNLCFFFLSFSDFSGQSERQTEQRPAALFRLFRTAPQEPAHDPALVWHRCHRSLHSSLLPGKLKSQTT